MNIEKEIFNNYKVNINKMIEYGFKKKNHIFTYHQKIMNDKFDVIITYDKNISGKIIECEFNEEYMNFRRENIGEYSNKVKKEFESILIDIRNACFTKDVFIFAQTKKLTNYINEKYGVNPEFLWEKYPSFAIYRKKQKWFSLFARIPLNKINKQTNNLQEIEIINLKISKEQIRSILNKNEYYPAYHMNKKSWVTIILNDSILDSKIKKLIDISYNNVI